MAGFDYDCEGQMSIFDLIDNKLFNPLEALALRGTGFVDGMSRVHKYFSENHSMQDKAKFLKDEYGCGGFGSPTKKPCYIHSADTIDSSGIDFEYYDEDMNDISANVSWLELAKTITKMVSDGTYIYKKGY